ncbi:uncharacterized protein MONBRDRAFT_37977 [Monosiga brevicollis MX1]|uniref:Uncharacterized protein n=1 Tax=Monosiga brevicollis TaxID=81824 RepID=A9V4Z9_MONBE|nr:uncharacterized protein MONBRDRAFT_37977 [Monosiga brevicollis MX1]EDQ87458.1 predicted protein [Monosiga brevicollis MX1]|eukprot:XP_001747718.1 hypothetical protein [Monosiga brevicollis MX1]
MASTAGLSTVSMALPFKHVLLELLSRFPDSRLYRTIALYDEIRRTSGRNSVPKLPALQTTRPEASKSGFRLHRAKLSHKANTGPEASRPATPSSARMSALTRHDSRESRPRSARDPLPALPSHLRLSRRSSSNGLEPLAPLSPKDQATPNTPDAPSEMSPMDLVHALAHLQQVNKSHHLAVARLMYHNNDWLALPVPYDQLKRGPRGHVKEPYVQLEADKPGTALVCQQGQSSGVPITIDRVPVLFGAIANVQRLLDRHRQRRQERCYRAWLYVVGERRRQQKATCLERRIRSVILLQPSKRAILCDIVDTVEEDIRQLLEQTLPDVAELDFEDLHAELLAAWEDLESRSHQTTHALGHTLVQNLTERINAQLNPTQLGLALGESHEDVALRIESRRRLLADELESVFQMLSFMLPELYSRAALSFWNVLEAQLQRHWASELLIVTDKSGATAVRLQLFGTSLLNSLVHQLYNAAVPLTQITCEVVKGLSGNVGRPAPCSGLATSLEAFVFPVLRVAGEAWSRRREAAVAVTETFAVRVLELEQAARQLQTEVAAVPAPNLENFHDTSRHLEELLEQLLAADGTAAKLDLALPVPGSRFELRTTQPRSHIRARLTAARADLNRVASAALHAIVSVLRQQLGDYLMHLRNDYAELEEVLLALDSLRDAQRNWAKLESHCSDCLRLDDTMMRCGLELSVELRGWVGHLQAQYHQIRNRLDQYSQDASQLILAGRGLVSAKLDQLNPMLINNMLREQLLELDRDEARLHDHALHWLQWQLRQSSINMGSRVRFDRAAPALLAQVETTETRLQLLKTCYSLFHESEAARQALVKHDIASLQIDAATAQLDGMEQTWGSCHVQLSDAPVLQHVAKNLHFAHQWLQVVELCQTPELEEEELDSIRDVLAIPKRWEDILVADLIQAGALAKKPSVVKLVEKARARHLFVAHVAAIAEWLRTELVETEIRGSALHGMRTLAVANLGSLLRQTVNRRADLRQLLKSSYRTVQSGITELSRRTNRTFEILTDLQSLQDNWMALQSLRSLFKRHQSVAKAFEHFKCQWVPVAQTIEKSPVLGQLSDAMVREQLTACRTAWHTLQERISDAVGQLRSVAPVLFALPKGTIAASVGLPAVDQAHALLPQLWTAVRHLVVADRDLSGLCCHSGEIFHLRQPFRLRGGLAEWLPAVQHEVATSLHEQRLAAWKTVQSLSAALMPTALHSQRSRGRAAPKTVQDTALAQGDNIQAAVAVILALAAQFSGAGAIALAAELHDLILRCFHANRTERRTMFARLAKTLQELQHRLGAFYANPPDGANVATLRVLAGVIGHHAVFCEQLHAVKATRADDIHVLQSVRYVFDPETHKFVVRTGLTTSRLGDAPISLWPQRLRWGEDWASILRLLHTHEAAKCMVFPSEMGALQLQELLHVVCSSATPQILTCTSPTTSVALPEALDHQLEEILVCTTAIPDLLILHLRSRRPSQPPLIMDLRGLAPGALSVETIADKSAFLDTLEQPDGLMCVICDGDVGSSDVALQSLQSRYPRLQICLMLTVMDGAARACDDAILAPDTLKEVLELFLRDKFADAVAEANRRLSVDGIRVHAQLDATCQHAADLGVALLSSMRDEVPHVVSVQALVGFANLLFAHLHALIGHNHLSHLSSLDTGAYLLYRALALSAYWACRMAAGTTAVPAAAASSDFSGQNMTRHIDRAIARSRRWEINGAQALLREGTLRDLGHLMVDHASGGLRPVDVEAARLMSLQRDEGKYDALWSAPVALLPPAQLGWAMSQVTLVEAGIQVYAQAHHAADLEAFAAVLIRLLHERDYAPFRTNQIRPCQRSEATMVKTLDALWTWDEKTWRIQAERPLLVVDNCPALVVSALVHQRNLRRKGGERVAVPSFDLCCFGRGVVAPSHMLVTVTLDLDPVALVGDEPWSYAMAARRFLDAHANVPAIFAQPLGTIIDDKVIECGENEPNVAAQLNDAFGQLSAVLARNWRNTSEGPPLAGIDTANTISEASETNEPVPLDCIVIVVDRTVNAAACQHAETIALNPWHVLDPEIRAAHLLAHEIPGGMPPHVAFEERWRSRVRVVTMSTRAEAFVASKPGLIPIPRVDFATSGLWREEMTRQTDAVTVQRATQLVEVFFQFCPVLSAAQAQSRVALVMRVLRSAQELQAILEREANLKLDQVVKSLRCVHEYVQLEHTLIRGLEQAHLGIEQLEQRSAQLTRRRAMTQEAIKTVEEALVKCSQRMHTAEAELKLQNEAIESRMAVFSQPLQEATGYLRAVDKGSMNEIRRYQRPPRHIHQLLAGVALSFEEPTDWSSITAFLAQPNLVDRLARRFQDEVGMASLERLRAHVQSEDFNVERIVNISVACHRLCRWLLALLDYWQMRKDIRPAEKARDDAAEAMTTERAEHRRLLQMEQEDRAKLAALRAEARDVQEQTLQLKATHSQLTRQLERLRDVSGALVQPRLQWQRVRTDLQTRLQRVPVLALLAAATLEMLGPVGTGRRRDIFARWQTLLGLDAGVEPMTLRNFVELLQTPDEIQAWRRARLVPGPDALTSACLLLWHSRQRLVRLVDAHALAVTWLRTYYKHARVIEVAANGEPIRAVDDPNGSLSGPMDVDLLARYDVVLVMGAPGEHELLPPFIRELTARKRTGHLSARVFLLTDKANWPQPADVGMAVAGPSARSAPEVVTVVFHAAVDMCIERLSGCIARATGSASVRDYRDCSNRLALLSTIRAEGEQRVLDAVIATTHKQLLEEEALHDVLTEYHASMASAAEEELEVTRKLAELQRELQTFQSTAQHMYCLWCALASFGSTWPSAAVPFGVFYQELDDCLRRLHGTTSPTYEQLANLGEPKMHNVDRRLSRALQLVKSALLDLLPRIRAAMPAQAQAQLLHRIVHFALTSSLSEMADGLDMGRAPLSSEALATHVAECMRSLPLMVPEWASEHRASLGAAGAVSNTATPVVVTETDATDALEQDKNGLENQPDDAEMPDSMPVAPVEDQASASHIPGETMDDPSSQSAAPSATSPGLAGDFSWPADLQWATAGLEQVVNSEPRELGRLKAMLSAQTRDTYGHGVVETWMRTSEQVPNLPALLRHVSARCALLLVHVLRSRDLAAWVARSVALHPVLHVCLVALAPEVDMAAGKGASAPVTASLTCTSSTQASGLADVVATAPHSLGWVASRSAGDAVDLVLTLARDEGMIHATHYLFLESHWQLHAVRSTIAGAMREGQWLLVVPTGSQPSDVVLWWAVGLQRLVETCRAQHGVISPRFRLWICSSFWQRLPNVVTTYFLRLGYQADTTTWAAVVGSLRLFLGPVRGRLGMVQTMRQAGVVSTASGRRCKSGSGERKAGQSVGQSRTSGGPVTGRRASKRSGSQTTGFLSNAALGSQLSDDQLVVWAQVAAVLTSFHHACAAQRQERFTTSAMPLGLLEESVQVALQVIRGAAPAQHAPALTTLVAETIYLIDDTERILWHSLVVEALATGTMVLRPVDRIHWLAERGRPVPAVVAEAIA